MKKPPAFMLAALAALEVCAAAAAGAERKPEAIVDAALARALDDVREAASELDRERSRIQEARAPLAREVAELNNELATLRERVAERRRALGREDQRQAEASSSLERLERRWFEVRDRLTAYRRGVEARVSAAETARNREAWQRADRLLEAGTGDTAGNLAEATRVLLETGLRGCREREFGTTFRGTAVNAQGRAVEGVFAVAGPFTFFVGADVAGVAAEREDSSLAHVFTSLPDAGKAAIRTLVREGKADVPVDVSGGRALRAGEERWAVARRLRQGGFVMVPLVLVAAAAVWVSLGRWRALRRLGTGWAATVRAAAETAVAGRTEAAQRRVEELPLPFRSVFAAGLQNRNAPREHLEELLHEMILSCLPTLEKHLGTLAVLGGVAPLLGLLGTVTGMIHTFQMITQFGAGGAKMLSGGISEALVTTEFGLVIAIPVTLVHAYFARRVRATVGDLESWAVTFVDILKSGGEPVS